MPTARCPGACKDRRRSARAERGPRRPPARVAAPPRREAARSGRQGLHVNRTILQPVQPAALGDRLAPLRREPAPIELQGVREENRFLFDLLDAHRRPGRAGAPLRRLDERPVPAPPVAGAGDRRARGAACATATCASCAAGASTRRSVEGAVLKGWVESRHRDPAHLPPRAARRRATGRRGRATSPTGRAATPGRARSTPSSTSSTPSRSTSSRRRAPGERDAHALARPERPRGARRRRAARAARVGAADEQPLLLHRRPGAGVGVRRRGARGARRDPARSSSPATSSRARS